MGRRSQKSDRYMEHDKGKFELQILGKTIDFVRNLPGRKISPINPECRLVLLTKK